MKKNKVAHIYWFAHYNLDGPCTRYRGKYVLEELSASHGVSYDFVYPNYRFRDVLLFLFIYLKALCFRKKNAITVFQKTYTLGLYSKMLKILLKVRKKNSVYDIDDAYYITHPPQTIHYFLKHVGICIAGSNELVKYSIKFSENKNVKLLSSPIIKQTNFYQPSSRVFTTGWTGFYNYHRESLLQLLFPALKRLPFQFRLLLLGVEKIEHLQEVESYFKDSKNVLIEMPIVTNWEDENSLYDIIRTIDVGVSPLLDNEYNRAKSAFKLKQYLCCGVPVIGSSTGENSTVIQHGENGFLADSENAFYNFLIKYYGLGEVEKNQLKLNAIASVSKFEMKQYVSSLYAILNYHVS